MLNRMPNQPSNRSFAEHRKGLKVCRWFISDSHVLNLGPQAPAIRGGSDEALCPLLSAALFLGRTGQTRFFLAGADVAEFTRL